MAIEYPDTRCELSPNHAHFFTRIVGSVWRCKYCWAPVWFPSSWEEATRFTKDIQGLGLDKAYQKHLQHKPLVKQKLKKLEDIRLLRKVLPERELMMAIAAIVDGKEEEENFVNLRIPDRKETRDADKMS